jgi:hypothetical protein
MATFQRLEHYDPLLNYALSIIAGWSYADGQTLANRLKYYGLSFATIDEISVVNPAMLIVSSAFLARSACGRLGVLSFRGTEPANAINWLTDADVICRPFGDGRVHRGFYANLEAVWEDISTALEAAMKPLDATNGHNGHNEHGERDERQPLECLYITGHSLGAAMAVLAAAKLFGGHDRALTRILRGVYTYGQPAVGDARFAEYCKELFGARLHRHVFASDVVPCLPPSSTGSFVHFGQERVAPSGKDTWLPPEVARGQASYVLSAVAASALSFVLRRLPRAAYLQRHLLDYSLEDHSPTGYIEASRSSVIGGR